MEYYIKEGNWKQILEFIKSVKEQRRKTFKNIHRSSVVCCAKWLRLLPKIYGHYRSVHKRFKRWCERGIWKNLLEYTKQEPDLEAVIIDGTIIRAHQWLYKKLQEALGRWLYD